MAEWTCDSNEALSLSLVRASEDQAVLGDEENYEGFNPTFTYPIYGEDEKIYGYRDLSIDLRFASGSLQQYLSISYSEKLPSTSTVDDVESTLKKFIPEGYYTDETEFQKRVEEDATTFRPPGQLIHSYTRPAPKGSSKGKRKRDNNQPLDPLSEDVIEYEVYHATWDTPGFREYHRRMQIFILLYIEAGSYINEDEDTWEFALLFEKRKRKDPHHTTAYHFIGYSSLYPFYYHPEKIRLRLSQFVIPAPFQRHGHGSELYKAIYQYIVGSPHIAELTVEDPAEAFEDLRDKNDLQMLLANERFMEEGFGLNEARKPARKTGRASTTGEKHTVLGKMGPPVDKAWAEKWRKDLKIAGRQFQRLVEMLILLHLNPSDKVALRAFRLQVKERLYRFNFEILAQLDEEEKYEKLQETFESVREDYHRILALRFKVDQPVGNETLSMAVDCVERSARCLRSLLTNIPKDLPELQHTYKDMSSLGSLAKAAATSVVNSFTETAKIKDLRRDTVESTGNSVLTTDHGVKVSDTDNWLRATDGQRPGATLLEDQIGREKIHRFDHERIPERVVHARGVGAHGYFRVFDDRAKGWTSAGVLTDPERTTPIFIRFSTVQGSKGSADTVRDVRGFAMKFYTDEGIWDLVGNNMPVFFIQDAIKFPDLVHAVKPEPHNEVPQGQSAHNNFWDFAGLQPESTHMIMWAMSDRGIPRSLRMIQGFGVNTYTLINAEKERVFVKFHMTPELGVHSLMWDEALKINGQDPDFHRKDLYEAIDNGAYPKWTFSIQVIEEKDENNFDFDILDATKIWPSDLVPIHPIGEFVLNRNVDEFFTETEQVAFCTSHVVPGIGFSDDPLLQGRNFSYFDTQISRLGINWEQLPINRPTCPVMNHNRGGQSNHRITKGLNYWPNRENAAHPATLAEGGYHEYAQKVAGIKQRVRSAKFQEHYNHAQLFLNSLTPVEKKHMISAFCFELSHCDDERVARTYSQILQNIDMDLAKEVAEMVNGILPERQLRPNHGKKDVTISQDFYIPSTPTIKGRRVAILVADGFNALEVEAVRGLFKSAMTTTWVVGPRRNTVYPEGQAVGTGFGVHADHHFEGQRSTMFDAIYIPSGAEHAKKLATNGRAIHWIREAFGHCKAIAASGEGASVVQQALGLPEVKFAQSLDSNDIVTSYGVVTTGKYDVKTASSDALHISPDHGFVSRFAYEISQHRCWQRELDGLCDRVAY